MSELVRNPDHLMAVFGRMEQRITELGLSRFDISDIPSHPLFLRFSYGKKRYFIYPFRLFEHFFPFFCRRLLGISPTLTPTTFFHLGYAYMGAREWRNDIRADDKISDLAEQALCLASRYKDTLSWEHPFASHGAMWRTTKGKTGTMPDSCAHNTARLGAFLFDAGRRLGNDRYIDAATRAAEAVMRLHVWRRHENGGWTVSYYPSTDDELINTAAEIAVCLAKLPPSRITEEHLDRIRGICRMIVDEQRPDGGWNYQTRSHCKRFREPPTPPDNHHNAIVLSALARLYLLCSIENLRQEIIKAIFVGLEYHLDNFCPIGSPALMVHNSRRLACVAGYCESIVMLLRILRLPEVQESKQSKRIRKTINTLLEHAIGSLYVSHTGDVGCHRRFGRLHNIRSIRWGSGLLMEAVSRVLIWPASPDGNELEECNGHEAI